MYCGKCGAELRPGAKFCTECGSEVKQEGFVDVEELNKSEENAMIVANLVREFKQGNEDAYNQLYVMFHDQMLRIALRHTQVSGHTNMQLAEDIVQDSMIKAYQKIDTLNDDSKFAGWLCLIVKNKCRDYFDKAYVKHEFAFTDEEKQNEEGDDFEFDIEDEKQTYQPDVLLDEKTREDILSDILNDLSEEQRIVTIMHFYDDMTLQEISEDLGISMSTVIGRFQTAKKKIKEQVTTIQKRDDIKLYNLSAIPAIPFFAYLLGKGEITIESSTPIATTIASGVTQSAATANATNNVASSATKTGETVVKKATEETTKKVVEGTAAKGTTGVVSSVASSTATTAAVTTGASMATKIVAGVAIAVTVSGGGYIAVKSVINKMNADNKSTEEVVESTPNSTEDYNSENTPNSDNSDMSTEEAIILANNEKILSEEGTNFTVDIPDGWVVSKETTTCYYGYDNQTKIKPVWYLYKGSVDKNNPYIIIDPQDSTTGLGGDWENPDTGAQQFTHNDYSIEYSYFPEPYETEDLPELQSLYNKQERFYSTSNAAEEINPDSSNIKFWAGNDWYRIFYVDHGTGSVEDEDFIKILDSFRVNNIGYLTLKTAKLNVRFTPSTSSEISDFSDFWHEGNGFNVYSIKENDGYTWYQIGAYSWVADDNGQWVSYTPNSQ